MKSNSSVPALAYSPLVLEHATGNHPENAERLRAIESLLRDRGWWERLDHLKVQPVDREYLEQCHDPKYLAALEKLCLSGGGRLTPDTPVSQHSWQAASAASGAVLAATQTVIAGHHRCALALVRPPGHHATSEHGMGFCLFNHVALAARWVQNQVGVERVSILDFDVHHGNGTEQIFYEDASVQYLSMHQAPAYPGTGAITDTGSGPGIGSTVNVPLPAGSGDAAHLRALCGVLIPAIKRHRPDLLLVSAGYDSHWRNQFYLNGIQMGVTVHGFGDWVRCLAETAQDVCGGRMVLSLEGGYDADALAWSVDATLQVLQGRAVSDPFGEPPYRVLGNEVDPILRRCKAIHDLE